MVNHVVACGALGEVIDGGDVQEHLEVKSRIVLQRPQDLFNVLASDRDRQVPIELPHADQFSRKALLESLRNWALCVLVFFEKANE